jgi:hypothetical protein
MPASSTMTPIVNITLTASAGSVTFFSLPQTYTDLVLVASPCSTGTSQPDVYMQVNGTSSTYTRTRMGGNGSSTFTTNITGESNWVLGPMEQTVGSTTNVCHFMNYSNTTTYKSMLNKSADAAIATQAMVQLWQSTAAITSIYLYPEPAKGSFAAGSTFTLYGVKAA